MAEVSSDQSIDLYGDLDLKIIEARDLPNMDVVSEHLRRCFTACDSCKTTSSDDRKSSHSRKIVASDPYVTVSVPGTTVARTRVIRNSPNPLWNEQFNISLAHRAENLEFRVKDNDVFGAQLIGKVLVPVQKIISGELISQWFPVIGSAGKPPKPHTELRLEMKFTPCEKNPLYRHGIAGDPEHRGVRHTYFPLRRGGSLTLYQDAHVPDGLLPQIKLDEGKVFEHHKCWEDICHAILEAHHLIYIVGWSIYHKVKLIREPSRPVPRGGDLTLGELLKYKSEEGVRVLMLVWDDKTSYSYIKPVGLMETHDEDTRKFFKHSSVNCVLSPRYASSKLSFIKQKVIGSFFTHHQKCVLVDTKASGNDRKITAFIGGLDLCDGRYDTPEHRLFHDLDTVFQGDYHNPTFTVRTKAPREPWHDLHCKIEGPAAYDVLINFEQRWRRATKWTEFRLQCKRESYWKEDALLKIERISWILSPEGAFFVSKDGTISSAPKDDPRVWVSSADDPENWHVQVFRSIDSGSVRGFPRTVDVADAQNLVCAKNNVIDKSIQTAYIQAIRSAQHFIYIENQYFLGSSYAWPSYKDAGADNLIPMELALKIARKIRAKERFAVYIVVPMWPEGNPKTDTMQEILFWQSQTVQMMYEVLARELKSNQLSDSHPLDYLNFYCLGKREEMPTEMSSNLSQSSGNVDQISDAQKFQRFMIYVHAKGMIVDDEYVILGSANINQRSLAGTKDTEIAMGAYQPYHTWAKKKKHPRGQIYGYRMSLWAEHLGMVDVNEIFKEPESLECVRRVNEVADDNWKRYTAETFTTLQGHLLKYPIQVDANGKVGPLPGHEHFPDAGGRVLGSHTIKKPDVVTT